MPSKNTVKPYIENGYYHIYNRGVEKRLLFQDQQDYSVFLNYLKDYLLPKDTDSLAQQLANPNTPREVKQKILNILKLNNFSENIKLLAYSLMPNHFHLLVKQKDSFSIDNLMNSLGTRYTMYFNRKYKRVGNLYQDTYKAVLVSNDEYLLHLSRYIHKQSFPSVQGDPLNSQPSSYSNYIGLKKTEWIYPQEILLYFSKQNPIKDYISFVNEEEVPEMLNGLILEED